MKRLIMVGVLALGALGLFPAPLTAQLNNKPFSFKGTPDGGIGMSQGGREAIIDEKLLGITPDNLVRAPNGVLLDVIEGPGRSAIVSVQGGQALPTFRGTSWKGGNQALSVGTFNAFFSPVGTRSSSRSVVFLNSSATVNTWTTRVVTNGYPASYSAGSTVDAWTAMLYQN